MLVFEGAAAELSLDGELGAGETVGDTKLEQAADAFESGCGVGGRTGSRSVWDGGISDVTVFDTALAPEDVAPLHDTSKEGICEID